MNIFLSSCSSSKKQNVKIAEQCLHMKKVKTVFSAELIQK